LDEDDVGELRKEVLRMLAALLDVAKAMQHTQNFGDLARAPSLEERVKAVLAMVSCGLDARSATLGLVQGVGPVFARKLVDAGIKDIGQLAGCDAQKLMGIDGIAQKRALEWLRQAQSLNVPGAAYRYEETGLWASLFSQPDGTSDRDRVWQLWAKARAK
jgi:predicted flap endonuclease-1-like 5' DNA nuclease